MDASKVAERLKKLGFPVLRFEEGEEDMDGTVDITEVVSVQVPTFGGGLEVSRFDGDAFHHFRVRATPEDLVPDIQQALKDAEAHGPVVEKPILFDVLCNGEVIEQREAMCFVDVQRAVDGDVTPGTCVVCAVGTSEFARERAVEASRALAAVAITHSA